MIALMAYYWLWLLVAFLIGLGTAWWVWGYKPRIGFTPDGWDEPEAQPEGEATTGSAGAGANSAMAQPSGDDLTHIKGIDGETASMLNLLGIRRYGEIAEWTDIEAEQLTVLLGAGPGRITEGQWIEQARLLASGNRAEHEHRFGHI